MNFQSTKKQVFKVPKGAGRALATVKFALGLAPHENIRLQEVHPRSTVVVVPNSGALDAAVQDINFFLDPAERVDARTSQAPSAVIPFPAWDVLPFDALSPAPEVSATRLAALWKLHSVHAPLLVTSASALAQRLISPKLFQDSRAAISVGMPLSREVLIRVLDIFGYRRNTLVEESGQFAARGAVVDFFPPQAEHPVRLELFQDTVESIRSFDTSSQRSARYLDSVTLLPATEFLLTPECSLTEALNHQKAPQAADLTMLLARLRARVQENDVPLSSYRPIEEAFTSRSTWPGIEHLQPFVEVEQTPTSLFDYLPAGTNLVLWDEIEIASELDDFLRIARERYEKAVHEGRLVPRVEEAFFSVEKVGEFVGQLPAVALSHFDVFDSDHFVPRLEGEQRKQDDVRELGIFRSVAELSHQTRTPAAMVERIERDAKSGTSVAIVISQDSRAQRVEELFQDSALSVHPVPMSFAEWLSARRAEEHREVCLLRGAPSSGVWSQRDGFRLYLDSEIFPEITARRKSAAAKNVRRFLGTLAELHENNFVVHADHGIAIYRGLRTVTVDAQTGDFVELEYAEGAKLLLPIASLGKIQKYVGAEGVQPALSKLGTKSWTKAKEKVHQNVAALAGQLMKLYAEREMIRGFSFHDVDVEDGRFADTFPFELTVDQAKAMSDVYSDMHRTRPMDRLICGDVGYGKTEVALRAAFKAVHDGKQVAVLVPTTVLADQHYATFRERLEPFSVEVACVSRFFSSAENKETLQKVSQGKIDVLIGTHRLLQKDVFFKDLGLLVIDEEHRFGVAHKERLKSFRKSVDVLTLTATPIPRTLHMSLLGIRDLSVLETPPVDRQVIRTYLTPYDGNLVREAIMRELGRSGQVFYVYNRVENIYAIAEELRAIVPEARILVGHGQMKEGELEEVMHKFVKHEADILVATTIVESGLDIPNANTMIIRNADRFGLAQLYQLRGRVGRSSRRAYAYMMIADPQTLGAEARKRLEVLQALDDLGQGFRLALQDMEIRGAGNLLGRDQSGQISEVGFDLYSKILLEAVRELQRKERQAIAAQTSSILDFDPEMNIGFPCYIPAVYVPDVADRLLLYQRAVDIGSELEARAFLEEIEDRFGHPPQEVSILVEMMLFRAVLQRAGIAVARFRGDTLALSFHPKLPLDVQRVVVAVTRSNGKLRLSPSSVLSVRIEQSVQSPAELCETVRWLCQEIGREILG